VWFEHRPDSAVSVRSVVGAGDCFVAFLAMCMCHSVDIRRAVAIAFEACSVYVGEQHNRPLHPYRLNKSKFVDPRMLVDRDFSLSFANGCFDILHPGHIELLSYAKSRADRLAVALNTDASVDRQGKSHPRVNDLAYRKKMVAALECVDFVLEFDEDTPESIIRAVFPDVLVKGSDWPSPVGADLVREVCAFGLVGGYSTTEIIRKIGDIAHR
jgi:D-beta-D-heptose 7-phosphate kinase/D-beta-D-heptose 1-phosphate adenosyltransferase